MARFLNNLKLLFAIIILAGFSGNHDQYTSTTCAKALVLTETFQRNHYRAHPLDDEFSQRIYDQVFVLLDPLAMYFTRNDLTDLADQRSTIDDQIKDLDCSFPDKVSALYVKKLNSVDSFLTKLEKMPFDYHHKDSLFFDLTGTGEYAANDKVLTQRWQKYLTYRVLNGILFYGRSDSTDTPPDTLFKNEPEIKERIIKRQKNTIRRKLDELNNEDLMQETFLNAIAMSYDPHSAYFPIEEKKGFESDLSRTKPSYGIDLSESPMGEVTIDRIVPGGPAWKSNELNKGDILLQVKTGSGRIIDMMETGLQEADQIMNEESSDRITLTVKKPDGRITTVKLEKEILTNEENLVQSFLLKGDRTIGYISLPGFYTDFNDPSGLGCANDVAKEILKLRSDKIQGLILDLRNNGGGSITEALGLSGIFINEGPLLMAGYKDNNVEIKKDLNRGTIYNGPLVILVNGYSASASEMVAATLQDYHRALIIGSPTYGKASGQVIIPMDTAFNFDTPKVREMQKDFVKITVEELFRLNGQSYQREGVMPDIEVKNPGAVFLEKESDYSAALKNESIFKHPAYNQLPSLPIDDIKKKLTEEHPELSALQKSKSHNKMVIQRSGNRIKINIDPDAILKTRSNDSTDKSLLSKYWKIEYPSLEKRVLSVDPYRNDIEAGVRSELLSDYQLYTAFLAAGYLAELSK